ncbi:MAG: Crp/Fnr family transcriptional regulator [Candidatus Saccharibacteria bacterium]|nr:Crp/Fnr family transcriptional regulator [Candidatus Saccharibacteria bacterium]
MLASETQRDNLKKVFEKGSRLTYKKGEYIIRPGETPSSVYFIESGVAKAYAITKYAEENVLILRKNNEIFPLIWSHTGQERGVIYEAITPLVAWKLQRSIYEEHLLSDSDLLLPILDMTTEMYRIHSERIMTLEYRTVRERLISFLLQLAKRFSEKTEEGILITVPLRQADIASSVNASRESATRELNGLDQKGLIKLQKTGILLCDIPKLKSFLE